MSNKEHPRAEILRAIADGKTIQKKCCTDARGVHWADQTVQEALSLAMGGVYLLRIKPETMSINGHEFPTPVREPLKVGQEYWAAWIDQQDEGLAVRFTWRGDETDLLFLKRGLMQLTKEGAIAQARATFAAYGGEV